jgi:solute carrier family 25 citrate transporter 1
MAIRFVSFEYYKDVLKMRTPLRDDAINFTSGLLCGLTEAILIVTPAEVLKIRMQSQRHSMLDPTELKGRKYGNVVQTAATVVREEGPSALYKGIVPTMLRQGCNQAVNFAAYNAMKNYWLERQREQRDDVSLQQGSQEIYEYQLSSTMSMLIGGLSGGMGPLVNNPLDVVKTRLQKQNITRYDTPKYTGLIQACFKIANEEGMGALWKGITPRLMRIVPGQAITFTTYEAVCRWL